ncbi:DUF3300 domain-containing protein [Tropicimonas marinistellae]|uniref:DUF3300 domain-containing protein n=1 Tax=Tropicimonas marinistellae TaxID=1739787 RepID=UPI0008317F37|nr:DUF3300 domain-containing protein [Tropicimonas marinistellae]
MAHRTFLACLASLALLAGPSSAQDASSAEGTAAQADLLTDAELQTLAAPVALYPDTLLIQVLVASTYPLDVVKADNLLDKNTDLPPEELEAAIAVEGFDPSVEVLATAFPTVIGEMADHVDWTDTMGNAMLAQSDDVMAAVQVLRQQAIETGALVDTDEQTVSVEEVETTVSTKDAPTESVVIQPADPEVVYVPQYDPNVVYDTNSYSVADAVLTGALAFGTVALIDEIFDDDDDWDDYWGCRNCAGWGGGPIYREPDIDIDVDGNVNIGNEIDFDRDKLNIDRDKIDTGDIKIDRDKIQNIDRDEVNIDRDKIKNIDREKVEGWKPDPDRQNQAKDKIAARRDEEGATTLPLERKQSQGDALRDKLSQSTGAADITRPGNEGALRDAGGGLGAAATVGAAGAAGAVAGKELLKKSGNNQKQISRPKGNAKPAANKPAAKKAASSAGAKKTANRPQVSKPKTKAAVQNRSPKPTAKRPSGGAIKKSSSGHKARKASARGGGKMKKRR